MPQGEPPIVRNGNAQSLERVLAPANKKPLSCSTRFFKGDRGGISCATSSSALSSWQRCSPLERFPIAPEPRMSAHRPTVRLLLMAHHPAIARPTTTARRQATVRLPFMVRQTTMARHLVTIRRHGRRAQFRMPLRRYARRAIFSGDAVPGAVGGAECAIRRCLRDLTAAMVRHPVPAITAPIEVIYHSATGYAFLRRRGDQRTGPGGMMPANMRIPMKSSRHSEMISRIAPTRRRLGSVPRGRVICAIPLFPSFGLEESEHLLGLVVIATTVSRP